MTLKYKFNNTLFLIFKAYGFLLLLIIGGMIWFEFDPIFLIIFSVGYLINILPGIFLHVEYWKANHNVEYEITDHQITVKTENFSETFLADELENIAIFMCASFYKKSSITYTAKEEFYFARITTKSGKELIVTNLLTDKLEEALLLLKGVPYERKIRFFCKLSSR